VFAQGGSMKREAAQNLIASPRSLSEKPLINPLLQDGVCRQPRRYYTRACEWRQEGDFKRKRRGVKMRRMRRMRSGAGGPRRWGRRASSVR